MSPWRIALASFRHYFSVNLAIALGVAAATAVLTGALLVGDSMRTSLRELSLDRLGNIDQILISQGFFSEDLASLSKSGSTEKSLAGVPAILFNNGSIETESNDIASVQRANKVNVFGVTEDFWSLDSSGLDVPSLEGDAAFINQSLANQLGIDSSSDQATIVLRIPKPSQLPAESALGEKQDLIESLVGLKVVQVLPDQGIARFNLHPSQLDSPNIFVPIELIQDALSRKALRHKSSPEQANVIFFATAEDSVVPGKLDRTLEDEGLGLKKIEQRWTSNRQTQTAFEYWSLSTDQMVLRQPVVDAIAKACPDAKPVFTYLANDIRLPDQESGIPFSMIAAIDFDDQFPVKDVAGIRIEKPGENEIVLNQWAAENLGVTVGDRIIVTWFEPETTHGKQVEEKGDTKIVSDRRPDRTV